MTKRIMNYMGHVIYLSDGVFEVALKRDGTDDQFESITDAMEAIEKYEEAR